MGRGGADADRRPRVAPLGDGQDASPEVVSLHARFLQLLDALPRASDPGGRIPKNFLGGFKHDGTGGELIPRLGELWEIAPLLVTSGALDDELLARYQQTLAGLLQARGTRLSEEAVYLIRGLGDFAQAVRTLRADPALAQQAAVEQKWIEAFNFYEGPDAPDLLRSRYWLKAAWCFTHGGPAGRAWLHYESNGLDGDFRRRMMQASVADRSDDEHAVLFLKLNHLLRHFTIDPELVEQAKAADTTGPVRL